MAEATPRRGTRTTLRRRFALALLVALVLHVPATPLVVLLKFLWFLKDLEPQKPSSWDYKDNEVVIPITLEEGDEAKPPPAPPSPPVAELSPGATAGGEVPVKKGPDVADAGAGDAAPHGGADAGAADAGDGGADAGRARRRPPDGGAPLGEDGGVAAAPAPPPAPASSAPPAPKPPESVVKDTVALAGNLKKAVKGKPNVALALWFSVMRDHPLGIQVSDTLRCNPQWKDFLGDGIDPVRDFEGIFITGPRLSETSKVLVAVQHKLAEPKVKALLAGLVEKSGASGGWLDETPGKLAARARADRADRIVFTHPKNMVFVAPPEGWEQLRDIKGPLSLPGSKGRALSLTLVTPWRPLRVLQVPAPDTLAELRLDIVATDDGGADVALELDDKDPETAAADAKKLGEALTNNPISMVLGAIDFVANGSHFGAKAHFSRLKLGLILGFVRGAACPAPQPDGGAPAPLAPGR